MGCNLRGLAVIEPLEMSDLSGQRVAVDTFLNAYQFITSLTGEDGKPLSYNGKPVAHLMGFLDRTTVMLSEGIDPVYVFDGRPHELKRETLKGRRERKTEAVSRWEAAVEAGDMTAAKKLGPVATGVYTSGWPPAFSYFHNATTGETTIGTGKTSPIKERCPGPDACW